MLKRLFCSPESKFCGCDTGPIESYPLPVLVRLQRGNHTRDGISRNKPEKGGPLLRLRSIVMIRFRPRISLPCFHIGMQPDPFGPRLPFTPSPASFFPRHEIFLYFLQMKDVTIDASCYREGRNFLWEPPCNIWITFSLFLIHLFNVGEKPEPEKKKKDQKIYPAQKTGG